MNRSELDMATRLALELDALRELLAYEPKRWSINVIVGGERTIKQRMLDRQDLILRCAADACRADAVAALRKNLQKQIVEVTEQLTKLGVEVSDAP